MELNHHEIPVSSLKPAESGPPPEPGRKGAARCDTRTLKARRPSSLRALLLRRPWTLWTSQQPPETTSAAAPTGPGLPKGLARSPLCRSLQVLNLSGNCFQEVPASLLELRALQTLCLGGNQLQSIPAEIENLRSLECLYLGGNFIKEIPPELANLPSLKYLVLCDNKILSVPPQLSQLHSLRSLSLHNNLLTYLPREILNLIHLEELSLRGNPLVVRFVRDLTYDPPTLLELAARTIKIRNIPYTPYDLPGNLLRYLSLASNCPNPKCGGVYFDCCVRQIKFVDFCGKYRLPLMHYLCSPECSSPCSSVSHSSTSQSESDSEDEAGVAAHRMQKVLLG
nr:PREDICTED: leucine-rich repeat-containing protein 58 [Equus przewalskii]